MRNMPEIADAWSVAPAIYQEFHSASLTSSDLDRMMADFLARGGQVEEIPSGVISCNDGAYNRISLSPGKKQPFTLEEMMEHQRKRETKAREEDSYLVAQLGALLPARPKRKEILEQLHCTDAKLQRLLRNYFKGEPLADPYRRGAKEH